MSNGVVDSPMDRNEYAPYRWTRRKILKRIILGVILLTTFVVASAWMLHTTTARNAGPAKARLMAITHWDMARHPNAGSKRTPSSLTEPSRQIASTETSLGTTGHMLAFDRDRSRQLLGLDGTGTKASIDPGARRTPRDLRIVSVDLGQANTPIQRLVGSASSAIDRAIEHGFDGAIVIVPGDQPNASHAERLSAVARHARRLQPAFAILLDAPDEFLALAGVINDIDAVVRRNLLTRAVSAGAPLAQTTDPEVVAARHFLERARRAGKVVFASERAQSADHAKVARERLLSLGLLPSIEITGKRPDATPKHAAIVQATETVE
ncbi:MAG: hypothetical protein AAFR60_11725 [Pseudomonadota bacterium]